MAKRARGRAQAGGQRSAQGSERQYAGKSRLERRAERRQQLIEAGLELFGTVGYRDTTIEQICAGAGVGIRAFYEEFGNRAELFRQVYDHVIARAFERVEQTLEESMSRSPDERLSAVIRAYLESMLLDSRCGQVASIESGALDRAMDLHRNQMLKRFAALVADALPVATRRSLGNVRLWSLMLGGAVNEVVIDCMLAPEKIEIEVLARELADVWNRTIRG